MFFLGPYYGSDSEHCKYAPKFFDSLTYPIYLSVQHPDMFDPSRHYCFGTTRNELEVTHDEIADIASAMHAAREAFLQSFDTILLTCSDHELRSALRRSTESFPDWVWREKRRMAQSVRKEVERGRLTFVPTYEDLRACVKAIQEDRQKPRTFSVPQSRATSSRIGDAHPFEYQPASLGDNATELAARGVGEAEEAECYAQYDFEMEECQVARATFQDSRTYLLCKQRAFENFQRCRGY
ncbi:hypothetical protein QCE73_11035 [Caballeronia sp. LZ029]|uniref:hypothetical protein n=1 Tax=Caballeronia sp. LZ029 TaxID=3038564 RepID=UPI0028558590|nr:hypothetical protein [Caballeronia sp. LZ029]MDR5743684.1 hypothetical protein [Caballeronia sp. LZ029]